MLDHGNAQLSAVGFFNPVLGQAPVGDFFGGGLGNAVGAAFDMSGGKIVNCCLVFGRTLVSCGDTSLGALERNPSGIIYAKVKHSGSELKLSVHHKQADELPSNDLESSYRLLYKALGQGSGKRWVDFRYMPVLFAMD